MIVETHDLPNGVSTVPRALKADLFVVIELGDSTQLAAFVITWRSAEESLYYIAQVRSHNRT